MKKVILLKEGEIFLKGLNKSHFENILIKNIKNNLKTANFNIKKSQSTILIEPNSDYDLQIIEKNISKIFGISKFCIAATCEKNLEEIKRTILEFFGEKLKNCKSFKISSKRSDKKFELNSQQLNEQLGYFIIKSFPKIKVDLSDNCELTIWVEIRSFGAYIYSKNFEGACGVPVGCSGQAMLLISGGIDSPVAGWLMAKRGLKLCAVHFFSPPYTSARSLDKVEKLLKILSIWTGKIETFFVNFTKIQETINKSCDNKLNTIINRRIMNKIAQKISQNQNSCSNSDIKALINGESLAQVASQTLEAIICTKQAISMPILQPLIGLDKTKIVDLAKKIGTFETSILPYADCCTVFVPPHPKTKPKIDEVLNNEEKIADLNELVEDAANQAIFKIVG